MPRLALQALDIAFFVLHTTIVFFNALGWMFKPTRRTNLILLLLTLASWIGMGLVYGAGYCICTDWHFRVRQALGYHDLGNTYIQFLIWKLTGWLPDAELVRKVTGLGFVLCLCASLYFNRRDQLKARQIPESTS